MKTLDVRLKLWPFVAVTLALLALSLASGCKLFGKDTSAPNVVEKQIFKTVTNFVEVPVQVTVTNHITNAVVELQTNAVGQTVTVTNEQVVPKFETVWQTNVVAQYENTVSDKTKAGVTGFSGILNYFLPGTGSMVGAGILAALGAWAQLRSGKRQDTSIALAQEVETIREFVKTLPAGAQYDAAITSFLKSHQMEAGVATQVLTLLENEVNNDEAKGAIEEIKGTLAATKT